jgi:hypothetical protein
MAFAMFVILVFSMCFCLVELTRELGCVFECHIRYTVLTYDCEFLAVLSKCPENNKGHAKIFRDLCLLTFH